MPAIATLSLTTGEGTRGAARKYKRNKKPLCTRLTDRDRQIDTYWYELRRRVNYKHASSLPKRNRFDFPHKVLLSTFNCPKLVTIQT